MARRSLIAVLLVGVLASACGAATVSPSPASEVLASQPALAFSSAAPSPSAVPPPSPSTAPRPAATPSPKPAPWQRFTSKKYHFVISYPPFWYAWPVQHSEAQLFDHSGYPRISVSRGVDADPLTLSEVVAHDIAWYKSHYHAMVSANRAIKVARYDGRLITYRGLDGAVRVVIESLQLVKGDTSYDLSMVGLAIDAASNASIFKRMYTSFKPT